MLRKLMSKTVSARIPNKSHEEILERCNRVGCSINEWLNSGIDYLLTGSSDFDFGDSEPQKEAKVLKYLEK